MLSVPILVLGHMLDHFSDVFLPLVIPLGIVLGLWTTKTTGIDPKLLSIAAAVGYSLGMGWTIFAKRIYSEK